jgi:hypothetical protein
MAIPSRVMADGVELQWRFSSGFRLSWEGRDKEICKLCRPSITIFPLQRSGSHALIAMKM